MMGPDSTLTLAQSLLQRRLVATARYYFLRAELEGADRDRCAAGRWTAAMLSGDLQGAWRESDAIRMRGYASSQQFWRGETLYGKRVIVRCLHGLGDAVQFLRYAPKIKTRAAHLVVECAPRAVELFRCLPGVDELISWESSDTNVLRPGEVQIEVMELPYLFRTTLADLPVLTNYLHLPSASLSAAATALGVRTQRPRLGVVWSAGEWNLSRSLPLEALERLLGRQEFEFWNLQGGPIREQWREYSQMYHLRDAPLLADSGLMPLASVIAQLDLVITVDTLAAHLAGALGVPCFVALQFASDWRWMVGRNDSPWYPSVRLFRQPFPGDWTSVVNDLDDAITEWTFERRELRLA